MQTTTPSSVATPDGQADAGGEHAYLILRLSALIFLAFAIMGAWVPVFSLHLQNLGFTPAATAWASSANAIGALLAPLLWGQIADRWLAMQRCISLCALAAGVLLWTLAELQTPGLVIFVCIVTWFFLIPALGLSAALVFRQLDHPEREYGKIRMWGTVGWVAASWSLTLWFALGDGRHGADFADSLRMGGLAAFVLAGYALTLPHTPPQGASMVERSWLAGLLDAPLRAARLVQDRSFVVFCMCIFGLNITLPFTVQLNPLLLQHLEVDSDRVPSYLTFAQSTEVVLLYLLPLLLLRFGLKPVMTVGGLAWALGLTMLSVGSSVWMVLAAFLTHGVCICCFFIAGQVYVNRQATHDIRASAQGLLLLISGSGLLLGHLLVGWIRSWSGDDYRLAYAVAASLTGGLVVMFLIGFSPSAIREKSGQESLVPDPEMP